MTSLVASVLVRKFPPKALSAFITSKKSHSMSDPTYQLQTEPVIEPGTKSCEVFVSTCRNIFYNLALEDWIYENVNLSKRNILLFWKSDPCIVIGRHQNPWLECNLPLCKELEIPVARRKSGGGTVYHDHGNLNCSFLTGRKEYDRNVNLELIASALRNTWNLDVEINDRDDMVLQKQYKISGTAAKLGAKSAYHHCTVLFNADKSRLSQILKTQMVGIRTKATTSVRSEVKNLCDVNPDINYEELISEIGTEYLNYYSSLKHPVFVDPTKEKKYPGLYKIYQDLKSWTWIYGKSPKFAISRSFEGFPDIQHAIGIRLDVEMEIEKGHISKVDLNLDGYPQNLQPRDVNILCHILQDYWRGQQFGGDGNSPLGQVPHIQFLSRNGLQHEPDTWGFTKDLITWMQNCLGTMLRT